MTPEAQARRRAERAASSRVLAAVFVVVAPVAAALVVIGTLSLPGIVRQAATIAAVEDLYAAQASAVAWQHQRSGQLADRARAAADTPRVRALALTPGLDSQTLAQAMRTVQGLIRADRAALLNRGGVTVADSSGLGDAAPALMGAQSAAEVLQGREIEGLVETQEGFYHFAALPVMSEKAVAGVLAGALSLRPAELSNLEQLTHCNIAFVGPAQKLFMLDPTREIWEARVNARNLPGSEVAVFSSGGAWYAMLQVPFAGPVRLLILRSLDDALPIVLPLQKAIALMGGGILLLAWLGAAGYVTVLRKTAGGV